MKIIDIFNNIDKSEQNRSYINIKKFSEEVNYDFNGNIGGEDFTRLRCYWVGNWRCTNELVGYRAYFLDDDPLCFSIQKDRKTYEFFYWVSKEKLLEVRKYLISLDSNSELNICPTILNMNEEVGEGYRIQYNDQVISWDNITLNRQKVEFIGEIKYTEYPSIDSNVLVKIPNGRNRITNVGNLLFPYHLNINNV